jgi:hypothetical protein
VGPGRSITCAGRRRLGGSAFTADEIDATHYLYDIAPIANPSSVTHTVNFLAGQLAAGLPTGILTEADTLDAASRCRPG